MASHSHPLPFWLKITNSSPNLNSHSTSRDSTHAKRAALHLGKSLPFTTGQSATQSVRLGPTLSAPFSGAAAHRSVTGPPSRSRDCRRLATARGAEAFPPRARPAPRPGVDSRGGHAGPEAARGHPGRHAGVTSAASAEDGVVSIGHARIRSRTRCRAVQRGDAAHARVCGYSVSGRVGRSVHRAAEAATKDARAARCARYAAATCACTARAWHVGARARPRARTSCAATAPTAT